MIKKVQAAKWYRVTVSDHGVKTVEEVSSPGDSGSRIFYVLATGKTEAASEGKRLYNEYSREKVRAQRARLTKQGLCRCGRCIDTDGLQCSVCVERKKDWRERNPGRKATTGKPRDEEARVAAALERSRDRRKEIRLETLLDVREKFLADPRSFKSWLLGEIERMVAPNRKTAS